MSLQSAHREFLIRNGLGKTHPQKNVFWSTLKAQNMGGKLFEFLHCYFESHVNIQQKIPYGQFGSAIFWVQRNSKDFPIQLLAIQVE